MKRGAMMGAGVMATMAAAIIGTSLVGTAQTVVEPAGAGGGATIKVERAELQRMIQTEVQKQLPTLVQQEVHRRMGDLVKRIEENQARLMREARVAHKWESTHAILQTLRSQLELYKIMHGDRFPTMEQMKEWRALTLATDSRGNAVAGAKCGPYLQEAPASPLTEKSGIAPVGGAGPDTGWVYDERTGAIRVVVPPAEAGNVKGLSRGEYEVAR